ncbi:UNVERIFIED_ORG: hypothetical protein FHT06_000191 [Xanthomonas campestris]
MPSPLAGHAVNPSMEAPWRHPCRQGSRNRQGHRARQLVGCFLEGLLRGMRWKDFRTHDDPNNAHQALLLPCIPTISTGPCPPTVAGPYAAWMPRKSLQGRTCGVSCDGGRARALQQSHRSPALRLIYLHSPSPSKHGNKKRGLEPCTPTISTGPCPPSVAGPCAAWMPRQRLDGCTCSVFCDGGRARALQPSGSTTRSTLDPCALFSRWEHNAQSNQGFTQ